MNSHQTRKLARATMRFSGVTVGGEVVKMSTGKLLGTVKAVEGTFVKVKRNTKRGETVTYRGHEVSGFQR